MGGLSIPSLKGEQKLYITMVEKKLYITMKRSHESKTLHNYVLSKKLYITMEAFGFHFLREGYR